MSNYPRSVGITEVPISPDSVKALGVDPARLGGAILDSDAIGVGFRVPGSRIEAASADKKFPPPDLVIDGQPLWGQATLLKWFASGRWRGLFAEIARERKGKAPGRRCPGAGV